MPILAEVGDFLSIWQLPIILALAGVWIVWGGYLMRRAALASVCYRMGHLQAELGDTAGALSSAYRALTLAQAEADAPGSTSEHRVQLAAAYATLGYVHRQIASRRGAAAEEQFENWRAARRFYQQAAGIYTVLKTGGRLSAYYAVEVESARKGLAESEAALAKLQAR